MSFECWNFFLDIHWDEQVSRETKTFWTLLLRIYSVKQSIGTRINWNELRERKTNVIHWKCAMRMSRFNALHKYICLNVTNWPIILFMLMLNPFILLFVLFLYKSFYSQESGWYFRFLNAGQCNAVNMCCMHHTHTHDGHDASRQ